MQLTSTMNKNIKGTTQSKHFDLCRDDVIVITPEIEKLIPKEYRRTGFLRVTNLVGTNDPDYPAIRAVLHDPLNKDVTFEAKEQNKEITIFTSEELDSFTVLNQPQAERNSTPKPSHGLGLQLTY